MKYRALGANGISVSEVGFGCWPIGGTSYGSTDDAESKRALERAFELGVNFYDTSDLYGDGHSEKLLYEVFKTRRSEIVIASKGGTLPHTTFQMPQDFSKDYLGKALAQSLVRLKTDYIDIYQLHSPLLAELDCDEVRAFAEAAKQAGKIRAFGVSVRSPRDAQAAVEKLGADAIQVNYNLIDHRAAENGFFDFAAGQGVGVIARTPLCFGFLSGSVSATDQFEDGDHRKNWPVEQLQRWEQAIELFDALYAETGRNAVQFALGFCLSQPGISSVIPGMTTVEHVVENTSCSELGALSDEVLERVQQIYSTHQFYDPTIKVKEIAKEQSNEQRAES